MTYTKASAAALAARLQTIQVFQGGIRSAPGRRTLS
jgi:hypothetical protein